MKIGYDADTKQFAVVSEPLNNKPKNQWLAVFKSTKTNKVKTKNITAQSSMEASNKFNKSLKPTLKNGFERASLLRVFKSPDEVAQATQYKARLQSQSSGFQKTQTSTKDKTNSNKPSL